MGRLQEADTSIAGQRGAILRYDLAVRGQAVLRAVILPVVVALTFVAFAHAAGAQTQPHVTVTVTGPTYVYPGQKANFEVTIDVDGPSSDVYLTWAGTGSPIGPGGLCCEGSVGSVTSGSAEVVGSQIGSVRLTVQGPRAVLKLGLELYDTQPAPQIVVSAYLPGTNVAQYQTINGWKSIVSTAPFPQTGGRSAGHSPKPATDLLAAGAAMLLLSAACFVTARRNVAAGR
jgi:hypothetical protein